MIRWTSKITAPQIGVCLQAVMIAVLGLSLIVGWWSWQDELGKRQTDATLRYIDPLMARDSIQYMWEIEEFTMCFERASKGHISYARFGDTRRKDDAYKIATRWWDLVENEHKEIAACGRPAEIEQKLMVVYGRLEALASCAKQRLCSFSRIVDMIEAFDYITLLSISNYLLLTRDRERNVSREWYMSGALVDLVELVEQYAFEGRQSAMIYATRLDRKEADVENVVSLSPAEIEAIRSKRTRCDQPPTEETSSENWRHCAVTERKKPPQ
jgi:hypothetical protein